MKKGWRKIDYLVVAPRSH